MADSKELAEWIRLEQAKGVGLQTARVLLSSFGLPEHIFAASFSALREVVPDHIARALLTPVSPQTQALIDRTWVWLQQPGNHVIILADPTYPRVLLDIPDPPLLLYAKGRIELLGNMALAIVGSRNATTQGMVNAASFAETLSQEGMTIVSGLASGIDAAAHEGSLRSSMNNGGSTIAVIGTGADIIYPARNRSLAHRIAAEGCIISEYPLGTPAIAANFPRRNRLISGLACGVLVVEAAAQSGSLITARMALEQGREVFAIPGSIHAPLSKGCHELIKQGAKLVESAQDILVELGSWRGGSAAPGAQRPEHQSVEDPQTEQLLEAMGFDPVSADFLAERVAMDISCINSCLLQLELAGWIEALPGGVYRRVQ